MKLKVFTLRLDPTTGRFDDAPMREFLEDKEALTVSEHFFVHEQTPSWALLVSYRDIEKPGYEKRDTGHNTNWRAALSEDERPLFDALRAWRNDKAKQDGKPAYILLTNRQLYEVARRRPTTLGALREIAGIGEAKVKDSGEAICSVVAASRGGARFDDSGAADTLGQGENDG